MTFSPSLWYGKFQLDDFPAFPCPRCGSGHLRQIKSSIKSKDAHRPQTADELSELPEDYIERRFSMLSECSQAACYEVVTLMGDFVIEEDDFEGRQVFVSVFRIKGMFPAPNMIEIPKKVPERIRKQLDTGFLLYWADYSACANALRTASEMLLDELKVPKTHRIKATATKPAKIQVLNFNGRVQWLEKRNQSKAKMLHGLRRLGNVGSHAGGNVSQEDLHAGLAVLEHLLNDVYVKHDILSLALGLGVKKM
jgi:hypothetical protein